MKQYDVDDTIRMQFCYTDSMITVSFVIPVYNSSKSIERIVTILLHVYKQLQSHIEIILVNDGSSDNSDTVCRTLAKNKAVVYICLSRNFGQHNALLTGIKYTRGKYVVCLDDDLETPPEESVKLLQYIQSHEYDVVYGQYKRQSSWFRDIGSRINNMMANFVFHKPHDVSLHSYFIINRFIADQVSQYDGPFVYLPGLIFRVTQRVGGVDIKSNARPFGRSNYSFSKLTFLWINGIINYSLFPLRLSIAIGLLVAVLGFMLSTLVIIMKLTYPEIATGWASLIGTVLVFGGLTLLFIGFVGEYVGRIFYSLAKNPQSVVRYIKRS